MMMPGGSAAEPGNFERSDTDVVPESAPVAALVAEIERAMDELDRMRRSSAANSAACRARAARLVKRAELYAARVRALREADRKVDRLAKQHVQRV